MTKKAKPKSRLMGAVQETASDLHRLGFISDARMRMYDQLTSGAAKGSRKDFEKFLRKVPDTPPLRGDELK